MRERTSRGESLYELDEDVLTQLDVDLTSRRRSAYLCARFRSTTCARWRSGCPARRGDSLDPSTLGEVLADVPRLAQAAAVPEAATIGRRAGRAPGGGGARRRGRGPAAGGRAGVDGPLFIGGHWVPQMIELAGGEDVLGCPARSRAPRRGRARGGRARDRGCRCRAATTPSRRLRRRSAGAGTWPSSARACTRWTPRPTSAPGAAPGGRRGAARHLLHPELVPAPARGARSSWTWSAQRRSVSRRPRSTDHGERAQAAAQHVRHRWRHAQDAGRLEQHQRRERGRRPGADVAAIEMPETVKVMSRLSPIQRPRPFHRLMPRLRITTPRLP